jgi:hypothetical protein
VSRPSDHALWSAVIETLRHTVLPRVAEPYAALQTQRVIGLATYARDRGDDPTGAREAAIADLVGRDDPSSVLLDVDDPRSEPLRRLLMAHLAADLATERVLLDHFDPPSAPPTSGIDEPPGTRAHSR